MLRYHVTCGVEKKIACVEDPEKLMDTIMALFSLGSGADCILQVWEPDFNDFVDVEDAQTLLDKSKLQLVVKGNCEFIINSDVTVFT
jgi:hypothetical protein